MWLLYWMCVVSSYCVNDAYFKQQENATVGFCWCNCFLLLQDSTAPTMSLTTPHAQINTPMGTQRGQSTFASYTT